MVGGRGPYTIGGVHTDAHAFYTWFVAKHVAKSGRAAGIAGAVGAALPDAPSFAGTFYFLYANSRFWAEEDLEAIYFTGPFGFAGNFMHSAVPVGALLALYAVLRSSRFRNFDRRRILLWFLIGWAGHAVADFLTHVDDTRPLFWPLSDWRWSSFVSYYNPRYHGIEFALAEHGGMLAIAITLLLRRRSRHKKSDGAR